MPARFPLLPLALLALAAIPIVAPAGTPDRGGLADRRPGTVGGDDGRPVTGAPGGPGRELSEDEMRRFLRGRALFERDFVPSAGLGAPEMNADSCRGCHQDPVLGGAGALELNVSRFARDRGGSGPYEDLPGGQGLSKLRPPRVAGREEYDLFAADVFEQRQTPSILGDGRIEAIFEAEILAREDARDRDGDGIRGVARRLTIGGATEIGRFGWKAQIPRLADFVRDALGNELGLTTPDDGRGFALLADGDGRADPEVDAAAVDDMAFFLAELAPPARVGSLAPEVLAGERLFARVGCARCHVPELDGPDGPVPLYSDLLLHDVWPQAFRGMSEPGAGPGSFRTPPLWGVRATAPYLHDGRASTLRAAILLHAGEAAGVRAAFEALPAHDKDALIAFLEDL
jgi:CxxC motif-containing protein (DUF1111 family)